MMNSSQDPFTHHLEDQTPLGKATEYVEHYDPSLLAPVPRKQYSSLWRGSAVFGFDPEIQADPRRSEADQDLEADAGPPVSVWGFDRWTGYELSWLNPRGLPRIAAATFDFPHSSPSIVESKSFKLYLNSLNQTQFQNSDHVIEALQKDLSEACGSPVAVHLHDLDGLHQLRCFSPSLHDQAIYGDMDIGDSGPAFCVDGLDVTIDTYEASPGLLQTVTSSDPEHPDTQRDAMFSHLLKSNCPVTGQPDWATVVLQYMIHRPPASESSSSSSSTPSPAEGSRPPLPRLLRESFLKYIVSYRKHADFHEHCLESIAGDVYQCLLAALIQNASPTEPLPSLTVQACARYTRRGGLDINPVRQLASFRLPQEFQQPLHPSSQEGIKVADWPPLGLSLDPTLLGHISRQ